jgi:hypothetical protein
VRLAGTASFTTVQATAAVARALAGGEAGLRVGAGGLFASTSLRVAGQPAIAASAWAPAAHAAATWGRRARGGTPFGELRAGWQGDPGVGAVRGALWTWTFAAGWRFDVR